MNNNLNEFKYDSLTIEQAEVKISKTYLKTKRLLDILVSLIGIVLLLPVYIITALAIKMDSSGPIIFKQERVGKDSKKFYIYKFRSMRVDTPNLSTKEFKNAKDFTTRVGKVIRKTSIDELPQLFNILKGDMSIVGPRPVIEKENILIDLRREYKVDKLLPGVTGWAQVNGRDYIDCETKFRYDYEYMIHRNIFMDIKIICLTILKVFKSENIR